MYTHQGRWVFDGENWTNWCEGFLGGQLWLLYLHTHQSWWQEKAIHYTRLIEPRKTDRSVHDLGFLFWPTWKRWYDLTQDPAIHQVIIEAGHTLALRYQPQGRFLCSFLSAESLFIDIMMNVSLIFYAAQQSGDERLYQIALNHCLTTRKYLVRGDGSTAHEGIFDLQSGQFLRQSTQQGWLGDSSWARGQAWALYGFGTAYDFTQDKRFLETAQACANFYIERTPAHGIPPNDWDEPNPQYPYESSAAAIACCGMGKLAKRMCNSQQGEIYGQYARRIFESLCTPEFLADQTPAWEGLLKHGIYHQRKGLGVDESLMWGDYFLLEAAVEIYHDIL
jgi:unsaturated chondroitin disaccharide hydrolase